MTKPLLITKGLKVYHTHNMKKKNQRDLSSYLKRSRQDHFYRLEAIVWGVWPTHQMMSLAKELKVDNT